MFIISEFVIQMLEMALEGKAVNKVCGEIKEVYFIFLITSMLFLPFLWQCFYVILGTFTELCKPPTTVLSFIIHCLTKLL